jgi:hypothetical protein
MTEHETLSAALAEIPDIRQGARDDRLVGLGPGGATDPRGHDCAASRTSG